MSNLNRNEYLHIKYSNLIQNSINLSGPTDKKPNRKENFSKIFVSQSDKQCATPLSRIRGGVYKNVLSKFEDDIARIQRSNEEKGCFNHTDLKINLRYVPVEKLRNGVVNFRFLGSDGEVLYVDLNRFLSDLSKKSGSFRTVIFDDVREDMAGNFFDKAKITGALRKEAGNRKLFTINTYKPRF